MTTKTAICLAVGLLFGATGCSEAVPPASEGAATVFWASSNAGCAIMASDTGSIGLASATEIELVKDTVNGIEIICSVTPNGDAFDIEAELRDPNNTQITLQVTVNGLRQSATAVDPALGSIGYAKAALTAGALYSSPASEQCRFWFADKQEIAAGRAWFQFGCRQVVDGGVGSTCGIQDNSTVAIQNCDQ
jgi:hypothetical protein